MCGWISNSPSPAAAAYFLISTQTVNRESGLRRSDRKRKLECGCIWRPNAALVFGLNVVTKCPIVPRETPVFLAVGPSLYDESPQAGSYSSETVVPDLIRPGPDRRLSRYRYWIPESRSRKKPQTSRGRFYQ